MIWHSWGVRKVVMMIERYDFDLLLDGHESVQITRGYGFGHDNGNRNGSYVVQRPTSVMVFGCS